MTSDSVWPELTLSSWEDTRDTFHMWTQVVGKIRLALEPMVNHWWQVTLYVSARGLTTSLMHAGATGLEIEFDLIDHVLDLRTTDGRTRHVTLEPRSVASFYAATMTALDELGVHVKILASTGRGGRVDSVRAGRAASRVRRRRGAPLLARARADPPGDGPLPCGSSSARRARCTSSGVGPISR